MQIQVEGIPFGNAAPLTTPTRVCETTLYVLDEVMQPTNSLADIPGFTELSELRCLSRCPASVVLFDRHLYARAMLVW